MFSPICSIEKHSTDTAIHEARFEASAICSLVILTFVKVVDISNSCGTSSCCETSVYYSIHTNISRGLINSLSVELANNRFFLENDAVNMA